MNNDYQELNPDELETDNHFEDRSTNNYRTLNENRAEASAW
jgi:hypothetical protein